MPLLTRYFIDHILSRKEVRLLFLMIAGLFGFMIFNAFVQYWTNYLRSYIGQKIGMDIKLRNSGCLFQTRYFIDHILPRKEVRLLFLMIAGLFGFMIFNAFVQYWTNYLRSYIGQKIGMDIKLNLYKHIVGLPIDYFWKYENNNNESYLIKFIYTFINI